MPLDLSVTVHKGPAHTGFSSTCSREASWTTSMDAMAPWRASTTPLSLLRNDSPPPNPSSLCFLPRRLPRSIPSLSELGRRHIVIVTAATVVPAPRQGVQELLSVRLRHLRPPVRARRLCIVRIELLLPRSPSTFVFKFDHPRAPKLPLGLLVPPR